MAGEEAFPVKYNPTMFPEEEEQHETIRERLVSDPSLRYQIRSGLATFNISPTEHLPLGYIRRSFIQLGEFCRIFNIPLDLESTESKNIAENFLQGCAELRDDFVAYNNGQRTEASGLGVFVSLPGSLQFLAVFKVVERYANPGYTLTNSESRQELVDYFVNHLDVQVHKTEDILQGAAIVYADKVLGRIIDFPDDCSIETANVSKEILTGPSNPSTGLQLGFDIEAAVSERLYWTMDRIYLPTLMEALIPDYIAGDKERLKEYQEFWPRVYRLLETAARLSAIPDEESQMWQAYLFAKATFAKAFRPDSKEGFDGGLDQLVSWSEPVEDDKYAARLSNANSWLELARRQGFDIRGLDLAQQSFALEVIDRLDEEIAQNAKAQRHGRINTIAKVLQNVEDQSLVQTALHRSPMLHEAIRRRMDPWGYRFR